MGVSISKIPNPIPAEAKSRLMATLMAARRSLESMSALAITGRTLTRADKRLMVVMSDGGSDGRHKSGMLVTGGSRMTGSTSDWWEKLFVRARGTSGAGGPGTDGGTMSSGSRKYIHLRRRDRHESLFGQRAVKRQRKC